MMYTTLEMFLNIVILTLIKCCVFHDSIKKEVYHIVSLSFRGPYVMVRFQQ